VSQIYDERIGYGREETQAIKDIPANGHYIDPTRSMGNGTRLIQRDDLAHVRLASDQRHMSRGRCRPAESGRLDEVDKRHTAGLPSPNGTASGWGARASPPFVFLYLGGEIVGFNAFNPAVLRV
jgi:hypothetical protein